VFPLVAHALARCPSLEMITLEHTDDGLRSDEDLAHFRRRLPLRLRALVRDASRQSATR